MGLRMRNIFSMQICITYYYGHGVGMFLLRIDKAERKAVQLRATVLQQNCLHPAKGPVERVLFRLRANAGELGNLTARVSQKLRRGRYGVLLGRLR